MFYRQCWKCGERWELGTASTCKCPEELDASNYRLDPPGLDPLYTSPPAQRTWVGLTDEEIDDLSREMVKGNKSVNWLSYSIEAKLRERNT